MYILVWYLIAVATDIVLVAFVLWIVYRKRRPGDGDDESQPNAAAREVRIVIHSPPPKAERMVYDVCTEESPIDGGCAICLDEYCDGERRATVEACGHRFHALCVEAWLRKNNSCPLCRHHLV